MTDDDKALVERLRQGHEGPAADRIEALSAENERLKKAIKAQASAVRTLQYNEETEINVLRKQKLEWHRAVTSLDSEREANAILTAENERLREALGWFLNDSRFVVQVGGNPNVVPQMIAEARAALGEQQ